MERKKGFSLIELLVSVSIITVLMAYVTPNLLSARERARDTKKKEELSQLKNALRMYYNDYQRYPAVNEENQGIAGCGAGGIRNCPCGAYDFAVGSDDECTDVTTTYMKKFPENIVFGLHTADEGDPEDTKYSHYYTDNNDKFCIVTTLENASDPDLALSQARCLNSCAQTHDAPALTTSYVVCSY
jgi:prepilin-type N-terminal cleavage/methylation domain-containing protein